MTMWRDGNPLILASQSRARRILLDNARMPFEAEPAGVDERKIQRTSGLSAPAEIAALLAREKALAVSNRRAGCYVIGADQTLALGTRLFDKPASRLQAVEQLRALAGRKHELYSAVAVARDGKVLFEHVAVAHMTMRSLSEDAIESYLGEAGAAVSSSVGAYQIEGLGVHLFDHVEGDHFVILGLPMLPLLAFFRGQGLLGL